MLSDKVHLTCNCANKFMMMSFLAGLEKEPKLSAALVPMLHKYAVSQKLSPVKVIIHCCSKTQFHCALFLTQYP